MGATRPFDSRCRVTFTQKTPVSPRAFAGLVWCAVALVVVIPAATGVVPRQARADTPAPMPALADTLKGPAKAAYEDAKKLFELKDYAGSATKYKVAYQLSSDFRLLKGIAACERLLLHYAAAYNALAKYLRAGKGKLAADQLASAQESMVALKSFFSLVTAIVVPEGATILVDGVDVGKSPLAPFAVDLGEHKVRVESSGYESAEKPILVPGKTEIALSFALKKLASAADKVGVAKVTISAAPTDAIAIDGKPATLGKYEGELAAGPHSVRVTQPGKKSYESIIDLTAGVSRTVEVTLVDEGSDGGGVPTWLWVTGGAVVVSGLAVGGYFLFKPGEDSSTKLVGSLETVSLKLFRGVRF